jgi:hypothetical protein
VVTSYWRAHEVEKIVQDLIPQHHEHLCRSDVTIRCVFRDTVAKSRGRIVLGKARKVSGLAAHLVGLVRKDDLGDDPADFFVIEVPAEPWSRLTHPQREALVDHELCHFWVSIPEEPDEDRRLVVLGHDLEEFTAIVERHGLWKPDLKSFAKAASAQLSIDDLEPGEVLRQGAGVVLGIDEAECAVDAWAPPCRAGEHAPVCDGFFPPGPDTFACLCPCHFEDQGGAE